MKVLKRLIKFTFVSAPKTVAELAEFNSDRIGVLTVVIMILIVFMAMFGKLPMWTIIK